MEVNGINIEIEYKNIKNMHLAVYPPDGRVHVSAPIGYSEEQIRFYVLKKMGVDFHDSENGHPECIRYVSGCLRFA